MAQTIKLKRSATSGAVPTTSQLELGEVAINTTDGKMYIKKSVGGTESVVEIGGTDETASGIFEEYIYTATNAQTTFSGSDDNSLTLSYVVGAIQVFVNGVLLDPDTDYTATNASSVVLASAAATGDLVQIFAWKRKLGDANTTINTFSGNGSTTSFTLSLNPGDENNTRVFVDGVYQSKSNYSVSGTTLTFSTAPPNGTAIEVEIGNRSVSLDTTSSIDLVDNVKLRLGTSQDLEVYHDASNSYIKDTGTGSLRIAGSQVILRNAADSAHMLRADQGGAVGLYHNSSSKLETTSTGIDVTGNIVTDGEIRGPATFVIDPAAVGDNTGTVQIKGNLQVDGSTTTINSTTLTVDDLNITLASGAANAAAANGAGITIDCGSDTDATLTYVSSTDDWKFDKPTRVSGLTNAGIGFTSTETLVDSRTALPNGRIFYHSSHLIYDSPSSGHRFAVAGNQSTNIAMVIDSGQRVGIGTTTPSYKFDIYGTDDVTMRIHRPSSGLAATDTCGIGFSHRGDTNTSTSDTRAGIFSTYNGTLFLATEPGGNLNSNPMDHAALTITGTDQNVGIGTTSPSSYYSKNLVVMTDGDGTGGITLVAPATDDNTYIAFADGTSGAAAYAGYVAYAHNPDNLLLGAGGATRVTIEDSGAVVINDQGGDAQIYLGGTSGSDRMYLARAGNDSLLWNVDSGVFRFGTSNAEVFRLKGNAVLIGSEDTHASSSERFLVYSTGTNHSRFVNSSDNFSTVYIKNTSTTANTNQPFLTFQDTGGNRGNLGLRYSTAQLVIQGHGGVGIAGGSGGITQDADLFVNSSGLVGIHTTSPEHSLHVFDTGSTTAGTVKIGGSHYSLGLELSYDQSSATTASIIANPTYTNDNAKLKLVVDGDRNPNQLVLDGVGHVLINGASETFWGEAHELQVSDTNFSVASFATYRNGSDGATLSLGHSRNGTVNSHTVLSDDDKLGQVVFFGSDGTDFASGASISASVDGTPGNNDMPTRLVFSTTADGADLPTEHLRITSAGELRVNNQTLVKGSNSNYDMVFPNNSGIAIGSAYTFANIYANNGDLFLRPNSYVANTGAESKVHISTSTSAGGVNPNAMVVKGAKVGIGTATPSASLHVYDNDGTAFSASTDTWHNIVVTNENTGGSSRTAGIAFELNSYHVNAGTGIAAVKNGTAGDYGADLVFITRPQSAVAEERMRITSSGNVGIGTTGVALDSTDIALQIGSSSYSTPTIQIRSGTGGTGKLWFGDNSGSAGGRKAGFIEYDHGDDDMYLGVAGATQIKILDNNITLGKASTSVSTVGFTFGGGSVTASLASGNAYHVYNTTNSNYPFVVSATGAVTCLSLNETSDERLKKNIVNLPVGLNEIKQLRPVQFDWKNENLGSGVFGFIAQEVERTLPSLVSEELYNEGGETRKAIKKVEITAILVKAIQEQQQLIDSLATRIAALEGE